MKRRVFLFSFILSSISFIGGYLLKMFGLERDKEMLNTDLAGKSVCNVMEYGAIGDGKSHPLSEKFKTLVDAQAYYGKDFKGRQIAKSLNDELDLCAIRKAFNSDQTVIILPASKKFIVNSSFSIADNKKILNYATIKLIGFGEGGHIVGINGNKNDMSEPDTVKNISWEGGIIDGNNISGVNGFGIEAAEDIYISNVKVINCRRDEVKEGGRGITCHPGTRNVTVIGCHIINCSTGLDTGTKADSLMGVDTLKQRTRNINFTECLVEKCEYSGFNIEQANEPTNLSIISQDVTVRSCQFVNCGSNWDRRGIINANKATNLNFIDCTIFNDVNYPVDSVFRGSFHKSNITAKVQVDSFRHLVSAVPHKQVNGIDQGSKGLSGTMEENHFDISLWWKNVKGALIHTNDYTNQSIDLMWKNYFVIKLYGGQQFNGNMVNGATHFTNTAEIHDVYNNRSVKFKFDSIKPLS
ncbi:hypothetical protein V7152_19370 [Neobacillus drentensis]|uniref:hypothetical protein n=1 Tax=Neobacillus drentensis TaxID=220684 RepID=UPI0030004985